MSQITPCLWFNGNGLEALEYYQRIFKDFKLLKRTEYGPGQALPEGTFLTAEFEVLGQRLMILNSTVEIPFTWAISLLIHCKDQAEVDYYWDSLGTNGGEPIDCGWLKDKYGVVWQVVPEILLEYTAGADKEKANRVFKAMMQMQKMDIAKLEAAANG